MLLRITPPRKVRYAPAQEQDNGARVTRQTGNVPLEAKPTSSQPRQTHFWLTDEDIQFTDDWAYQLRRNGWQRATRSACMRVMIHLLRQANVDLADVSDEAALMRAIQEALSQH